MITIGPIEMSFEHFAVDDAMRVLRGVVVVGIGTPVRTVEGVK